MRTHNFATLASLTQSEGHAEAYSTVMQFLSKQSPGTVPLETLRDAPDVEKQLIVMLAMYQFMAFAVATGLIDRKLVQQQFLPSMKNLVGRFQVYIDHYRKSLDRPAALSELTDFVKRYG